MAFNPIYVLPHVKARLNRLAGDTALDSYLTSRIAAASDRLRTYSPDGQPVEVRQPTITRDKRA